MKKEMLGCRSGELQLHSSHLSTNIPFYSFYAKFKGQMLKTASWEVTPKPFSPSNSVRKHAGMPVETSSSIGCFMRLFLMAGASSSPVN